ncbi:methyltransferase domain-containing protein [Bordetella genomosp. 11]|uniref:Methyltransferase type 12 n=1 Tax=Bordetella genomosp. 11 TaxID=1416808 RepID=A0A261UQ06_9BORD|nr:methyltransferase domain-containing protein [Bordetella genomosp. 11]OZI63350.1 methyltransferase type 12 [Bordetella genomosp. 11]
MVTEQDEHSKYLGQFIPLQYHHVMLMDANRMKNFKAAIDHVVRPGAKVLELGGGTGVLSWFAAAKADKVWCVEFNRELVTEANRFLDMNPNGDKVEVVHADAFDYLPPEPVDVMICEMVHVAMLREKQVEMMESFKRRYRERFGPDLPILVPTAVVMAVQPLQKAYDFEGFQAPIIQVEELSGNEPGTFELGAPAVYSVLDFTLDNTLDIAWEGTVAIERSGMVTSLRFITKNILAMVMERGSTIDWLNRYMSFPLRTPVRVEAGDTLRIRFQYRAGDFISVLMDALQVEVVR